MSTALPNVFSAFAAGRAEGAATANGAAAASSRAPPPPPAASNILDLASLLRVLERQPEGRMPFAAFSSQLPGDAVSRLSQAVGLMKEGWLEFIGAVAEDSDVRITDAGRQVIETLNGAVSAG